MPGAADRLLLRHLPRWHRPYQDIRCECPIHAAGTTWLLLKDTLPGDLLTAIRVVAAGEALLAPSVTRRLIGEFTRTQPGAGPSTPHTTAQVSEPGASRDRLQQVLTEREFEVLRMVARGMSNAEIAEELTISPATAKTHVAHLLTKLDARDRIQLVIIAYQSGLAAVLALRPGPCIRRGCPSHAAGTA
jgi:DNA-binding NarL/FixJ family response regulator